MLNLQRLLRIGFGLAFNPARIVEDAADAARRTAILAVSALIAGCILLPALGCAAAALWIFVQGRLGPVWAAIITALALLIVAAIILLIGLLLSRRRPAERQRQDAAGRAAAALAAWPAAALAALPAPQEVAAASRSFFGRHKGTALLAAAVIGLVLGQDMLRPRPRRRNSRS